MYETLSYNIYVFTNKTGSINITNYEFPVNMYTLVVGGGGAGGGLPPRAQVLAWELGPSELQDLVELMASILKAGAESGVPIAFKLQIEVGKPGSTAPDSVLAKLRSILEPLNDALRTE